MKRLFLFFLLPTILFVDIFAAENDPAAEYFTPVTTGVPFMTVAPDARGGGLGDVGAATTPDGESQYWNPAKFAFIEGEGGASISYTPWLRKLVKDIDLISAAGYYKIKDVQTVGMSFRFFSLGEVIIRKDADDPGITVKPYDLALDASYSRLLSKDFSLGVALRYIYSDLTGGAPTSEDLYPGWAIAADIAGYYQKDVDLPAGTGRGAFGFNISNIGSKINYGDYLSSAFLPTNLRLGGSWTQPFDQYNNLSFNVDLNKLLVPSRPVQEDGESDIDYGNRVDDYYKMDPISGIFKSFGDNPNGFSGEMEEIMFSIGLEYDYKRMFFARMGYFNESKSQGNRKYMTFGAGFALNVFSLDVAYVLSVTTQNPLDQTLRFTLAFNMAGLKGLGNNDESKEYFSDSAL